MSGKKTPVGVYVHIPFCERKCPYCDFYSSRGDEEKYDKYTEAAAQRIRKYGAAISRDADTLYFGGGTPSLLGAERLSALIKAAGEAFGGGFAEVTVEVNPSREDLDFERLREAGANRISIGLQSADEGELAVLGRTHRTAEAKRCIDRARAAGFDNISLDLMIALPGQTEESLRRSVDFCAVHGASHISAYILKIEPGTVFYKKREELDLPDEDAAADMYEYLCGLMREYGYQHYEISNFCREGYEGRHNLKYWRDEEYIGIGPSAHSFIGGKRFYVPRRMQSFYDGVTVPDGEGGSAEEFIMLALRLSEGVSRERYRQRFGCDIPSESFAAAKRLSRSGLVRMTADGFALTEKGMLLSNSVIAEILYE